jgi:membrane-associated phospholipid phosphatase
MNFSYRFLKAWWLLLGVGVAFLTAVSFLFPKADGFLFVQLPHTQASVVLFKGVTFLGDGIFTLLVFAFLALKISYRKAITLLSGYLIASLIVQLTKLVILPDMPRPVGWFEIQNLALLIPEGLSPHKWNSFPSGHSASVAGLSLFLASFAKRTSVQLILAGIALVAGYSRIYLFMHFPVDVVAGLCIGAGSMVYAGNLISTIFEKRKPGWAEKSILKI